MTNEREYSTSTALIKKQTDIVVGIPAYNEADNIAYVVKTVKTGLIKYFPSHKTAIVVSDGGSTDSTLEEAKRGFSNSETNGQVSFDSFCYRGISGKGSAIKAIFETARSMNSRVCVMVDADLKSIMPEWIRSFVHPVLLEGYDIVAPRYLRHKYDGTITNSVVYPLISALYGKKIRQPIAGDF